MYCDQLRSVGERLGRANLSDPALGACVAGLARVEEVLRRPLRVVILGEYNSGKTSVADLLLGHGLLPTSVVSNTRVPVLITFAPSAALYGFDRNQTRIRVDSDSDDALTDLPYRALQVTLPLDRLRTLQILDTPSSVNPAVFVADADIVIWCTVATRAWTESERIAWANLPARCLRNAILVATHKDSLQTKEDCEQVTLRLRQQASGLFREVVLVGAESADRASREGAREETGGSGADLRDAVQRVADGILERKTQKAEKIVRRLARLTFHEFASREVRTEATILLAAWNNHARGLVGELAGGRKNVPDTIETLLTSYALFAEKLRPGVVTGDSIPASSGRALAAPVRWPAQSSAATRLVDTLVSDLTGLLRMLAGTSTYMDPATRFEIQATRSVLLSLADLDGAFDALSRMVRASGPSQQA